MRIFSGCMTTNMLLWLELMSFLSVFFIQLLRVSIDTKSCGSNMLSTSSLANIGSLSSCEPSAKRVKMFSLPCNVCYEIYADPNDLYEHMRTSHSELYVPTHAIAEAYDDESEHDISDEEYSELCRLLEPICEIRQFDDTGPATMELSGKSSDEPAECMYGSSLQLQLDHQLQMNQRPVAANPPDSDREPEQKVVIRKCQFMAFLSNDPE